jgi:hypothetical protein
VAVAFSIAHGVGEKAEALDGDIGDLHGLVPGLL